MRPTVSDSPWYQEEDRRSRTDLEQLAADLSGHLPPEQAGALSVYLAGLPPFPGSNGLGKVERLPVQGFDVTQTSGDGPSTDQMNSQVAS